MHSAPRLIFPPPRTPLAEAIRVALRNAPAPKQAPPAPKQAPLERTQKPQEPRTPRPAPRRLPSIGDPVASAECALDAYLGDDRREIRELCDRLEAMIEHADILEENIALTTEFYEHELASRLATELERRERELESDPAQRQDRELRTLVGQIEEELEADLDEEIPEPTRFLLRRTIYLIQKGLQQ